MMTKAFDIPKYQVVEAYRLVKANAGAAGIDHQSLTEFEAKLKNNLYKIWNRLSSGSYFPPPVMAVEIPKKSGGVRVLGIPTVSDRIAQMVVKLSFEQQVEPYFLNDSYGYRPYKSGLDAIGITRKRCWRYDWVLEFDIKGLFDNISHNLLMKAVEKHTQDKWVKLYIKRWLTAPMVMPNGKTVKRDKGTPQGGVISPVLANLFLHYTFDKWMQRKFPRSPWCRYADDGLVHCNSEKEALAIKEALAERLEECGLQMHPDKTKIVYCKNSVRKHKHDIIRFDFLGYTFSPRSCKSNNKKFIGFTPAVSKAALKSMRNKIKQSKFQRFSHVSLEELAKTWNPILRGWHQYYGKYAPSWLAPIWNYFNLFLMKWAMHKYKKLNSKTKAAKWIEMILLRNPRLFYHWQLGVGKNFVW